MYTGSLTFHDAGGNLFLSKKIAGTILHYLIHLLLFYYCFIIVLLLFYYCFIIVLLLFYYCFIIVLILF